MLDEITPVLLTYNEEANIGRTLARLDWAADIVLVDSFSTDGTVAIAKSRPNLRLFQRAFDSHAQQWNFAIQASNIKTQWILALDADYVLTEEFVTELTELKPEPDIYAFFVPFRYCIGGQPLRGSLYPPVSVLYRREKAYYVQDGHTQRLRIEGRVATLRSRIMHDDRKPLSRWVQEQDRYMRLEAQHISETKWFDLGAADKIRRYLPLLAPFLIFAYCYFGRLTLLDGKYGLYYSIQRMLAESLLILRLIELRWRNVL
jgi:glycosyltransferase involved in cell wall biosynthesis